MAENTMSEGKGKEIFFKNNVIINLCSEMLDAKGNTNLLTSPFHPTVYQSGNKFHVLQFICRFHFPCSFSSLHLGYRPNFVPYQIKGATWDHRPGFYRCRAAALAVQICSWGNAVLGSNGQDKHHWIERGTHSNPGSLSSTILFLLKKVQLERGRLWFLGHTKSFLKAPGTCISRNCLFK